MIVVEGCDGTGKSTLVRTLAKVLDVSIHERACTSEGGPVSRLMHWAYDDVCTMAEQEFAVYDRHPLISEFVYGPIVRSKLPTGFDGNATHNLIRMMAKEVLVVWCQPPLDAVRENLRVPPNKISNQMAGVIEHHARIHTAYTTMRQYWPGESVIHDYTKPDSLEWVVNTARLHMHHFRGRNK
jgi:energy-coupling factor transporter ATP-binding protein EcfA2